MSLKVAGRLDQAPEVGLDTLTQGKVARYMEGADVCGPGGPNAAPAVVQCELLGQSAVEVVRLSNVDGIPIAVRGQLAEDIDAGSGQIGRPDGM